MAINVSSSRRVLKKTRFLYASKIIRRGLDKTFIYDKLNADLLLWSEWGIHSRDDSEAPDSAPKVASLLSGPRVYTTTTWSFLLSVIFLRSMLTLTHG